MLKLAYQGTLITVRKLGPADWHRFGVDKDARIIAGVEIVDGYDPPNGAQYLHADDGKVYLEVGCKVIFEVEIVSR